MLNGEQMSLDEVLLEKRIIYVNGVIDGEMAAMVIKQLLYLEYKDQEKEITLYINSPGGSVRDGMAIYDTMQYVECPVATLCVGTAASMAAVLLAAGEPGRRFALPNSEVLLHQPLGGGMGQTADVLIVADRLKKTREKMNLLLAELTGKEIEKIREDTDRDYWMDAPEALEYGVIDGVKYDRKRVKKQKKSRTYKRSGRYGKISGTHAGL